MVRYALKVTTVAFAYATVPFIAPFRILDAKIVEDRERLGRVSILAPNFQAGRLVS